MVNNKNSEHFTLLPMILLQVLWLSFCAAVPSVAWDLFGGGQMSVFLEASPEDWQQ